MTPVSRGPIDPVELSRRAAPILVVAAVLSWGVALVAVGRPPEPDLGPFLLRAFPGASFEGAPPGVMTARADVAVLGHVAVGTADGYSGPITVAVATGPEGRTRALALLEHRDTPAIVRSGRPLLRSLLGRAPDEAFRVGEDVDAVTGATATSRGVSNATGVAARAIAREAEQKQAVVFGAPEVVVLALLAVAALGQGRRSIPGRWRRRLRAATLVLGLVALGLLFARPWVIAFPIRLLSGDWPSWRTHLYWYVLLVGTLLTFSRAGKSPYCPWMCPFGAAQDLLGLPGRAPRRRLPNRLLFAWVKGVLLWLAVLLGLLYRNPAGASYEVFGAFFRLSGTGPQIAVLVVVLVVAGFFARPFCHWVCPVDAIERVLRPVRRRVLRGGRAATPRSLRLAQPAAQPARPVFHRVRAGALTVAGLLCAGLLLVHLALTLTAGGAAGESGIVGDTFVSVDGPPR